MTTSLKPMNSTATTRSPLTKKPKPSLLAQLPAILEACARTGVATLKCGDIEVSFIQGLPQSYVNYGQASQADLPNDLDFPASQASEQPRIENLDTSLLEDMRRSQLMIDDPLSYEQEMIDEHLERGTSDVRG